MIPYAELHMHSAYSFLDGVSAPAALVARAAELEIEVLALTDHGSLAGAMEFATAAREVGIGTVIGAEFTLDSRRGSTIEIDPPHKHLLVLARDLEGYRRLSRAISAGLMASKKKGVGSYELENLAQQAGGHWQILTGCRKGHVRAALESSDTSGSGQWDLVAARQALDQLCSLFGKENVAMELTHSGVPLDAERNQALVELAQAAGVRYVAANNVHMALASEKRYADVAAALRARRSVPEMEGWLAGTGSFLKSGEQMLQLFTAHPQAIAAAAALGKECAFDMRLAAPRLPRPDVPTGHTPISWLCQLVEKAGTQRYGPRGSPQAAQAWAQLDHELATIQQLDFAGYFLIVHEIVEFCSQRGIWCQGRGSAANSAVCFVLGITAVDAVKHQMLFERFLSSGRIEPPDIDLDIESSRREEVIQHVYERYGRHYAAQVAAVITYRPRSAIRDAARALGYCEEQVTVWSASRRNAAAESAEIPELVQDIAAHLERLPRHLGIHSGGMVLCDRPVIDVCPVGWASKPGRTVLQWAKEDCADAGLVKFDLLGLGMLTALRLSYTQLTARGIRGTDGGALGLHNIGTDDPRVYDLLSAADTVGVFQVESRAQMATLPRIAPRNFYDIVIDVALIRPGPIQGGSVNPYIRRRQGLEPVTYLHPLLKPALRKTLGVPLFQEQLMRIAIDAAGFSPAEADQLRKAMGSKRSHERMGQLKARLLAGMQQRGISDAAVREAIYSKLEAFADFGFPESHAFSFAYLVYASAWLKVHYPEYFYMGILAAQPMGFYSPRTLVADAQRHGVRVLPVDVNYSQEKAAVVELEAESADLTGKLKHPRAARAHNRADVPLDIDPARAIRLGLDSIRGLSEKARCTVVAAREQDGKFISEANLAQRTGLGEIEMKKLARAGAFESLQLSRRESIWQASAAAMQGEPALGGFQPILSGLELAVPAPSLPAMSRAEEVYADLAATGISARGHIVAPLRAGLEQEGVTPIAGIAQCETARRVKVAGIVTHRQRPRTARGITFLSLEDETGLVNVACSTGLWARYRSVAQRSAALIVRGLIERDPSGAVTNVKADKLEVLPLSVTIKSRDYR